MRTQLRVTEQGGRGIAEETGKGPVNSCKNSNRGFGEGVVLKTSPAVPPEGAKGAPGHEAQHKQRPWGPNARRGGRADSEGR